MDAVALTTVALAATTSSSHSSFSSTQFSLPFPQARFSRSSRRRKRDLLVATRKSRLVVSAASNGPELDEWDKMELKFGHYLGEDPKLTIAKIRARKLHPDASYLEVEKEFYRNKGKMIEIEELPFDPYSVRKKNSSSSSSSSDGLNLNRPVLKQGMKFQEEVKKPANIPVMKKPSRPVVKGAADGSSVKRSVPNVILRKPSPFGVDDDNDEKDKGLKSRVKMIQPNLMLKMRSQHKNESFTDMTLLRKPENMSVEKKQESPASDDVSTMGDEVRLETVTVSDEKEKESPANVDGKVDGGDRSAMGYEVKKDGFIGFSLLQKPLSVENEIKGTSETGNASLNKEDVLEHKSAVGMQQESITQSNEVEVKGINQQLDSSTTDTVSKLSIETSLQGKPKRLDQQVKQRLMSSVDQTVPSDSGSSTNSDELQNLPYTSPMEDAEWSRAEEIFKAGDRAEVELVSSSTQGFIVSFGSLIGFLPYRNLAERMKFIIFETWLRQRGVDPSAYKQNVGVIETNEASEENSSLDSTTKLSTDTETPKEITSDMKFEDLLKIHDQEKLKFLTTFVGQKFKLNVVMADKRSRKLIFSMRPREKEESKQKKKALMAKLQVGDVVQCCVKRITYFGVFVEVEDVPALIHQSELSWDSTLDPASYFKLGQIVEAKVHKLDFELERIGLSLKEMVPDPLAEAWEDSIFGGRDPSSGKLQPGEADSEWAEVESLIKELQQIEGIQSVTKGRCFLSSGLAPTFQVYMASMFEDQYKLLARAGNRVQEVIVQASLDNEEMKWIVSSCTNKV